MNPLQEGKVCQITLTHGFVLIGVYKGRSGDLPNEIVLEPCAVVINTGDGGGHTRFQREGPREDSQLGPIAGPCDLNLNHCLSLNTCPWPKSLAPYTPEE